MKKSRIALLAVGGFTAFVFLMFGVLLLYGFAASVLFSRYASSTSALNTNIQIVEDSIEWKLVSLRDDARYDPRVSFRFTVHNPTNDDILVDVYPLRIQFLDAHGFTLGRYNWTDEFIVSANGEYTYKGIHELRGELGAQVAFVEVLGIRSK